MIVFQRGIKNPDSTLFNATLLRYEGCNGFRNTRWYNNTAGISHRTRNYSV